jgi:hypothetical protein
MSYIASIGPRSLFVLCIIVCLLALSLSDCFFKKETRTNRVRIEKNVLKIITPIMDSY